MSRSVTAGEDALSCLIGSPLLVIKGSPAVAVIGVVDLTREAVEATTLTYEPIRPFLTATATLWPPSCVHLRRCLPCRAVYTSVPGRVRFSWDPRKSGANLATRGFDFEFARLIFEGPTLERPDDRKDYGEWRVLAIGLAQGLHLTVAYADRHAPDREIERRITGAKEQSP